MIDAGLQVEDCPGASEVKKNEPGAEDGEFKKELDTKEAASFKAVAEKYRTRQNLMELAKPVILPHPPAPPRRQEPRIASSTSTTPSPTYPRTPTSPPTSSFGDFSPMSTPCTTPRASGSR